MSIFLSFLYKFTHDIDVTVSTGNAIAQTLQRCVTADPIVCHCDAFFAMRDFFLACWTRKAPNVTKEVLIHSSSVFLKATATCQPWSIVSYLYTYHTLHYRCSATCCNALIPINYNILTFTPYQLITRVWAHHVFVAFHTETICQNEHFPLSIISPLGLT